MSSSEDEAPETVTHAASRSEEAAKRKDMRAFEEAERERRKTRNRAQAQRQQDRAEENGAVARMERAMREAQDENEDEEDSADENDEDGDEDMDSADEDDDEPRRRRRRRPDSELIRDGLAFYDSQGEDEDMGSTDDDGEPVDTRDGEEIRDLGLEWEDDEDDNSSKSNDEPQPSYLPDHLFKDALAAVRPPKAPQKELSRAEKKVLKRKAKARRRKDAKDVLLGDRTVRVLPSGAQTARGAAQRTVAPASANKFVRRSLLLNKSDRKREWERKSADIGMSRAQRAPQHRFVRR